MGYSLSIFLLNASLQHVHHWFLRIIFSLGGIQPQPLKRRTQDPRKGMKRNPKKMGSWWRSRSSFLRFKPWVPLRVNKKKQKRIKDRHSREMKGALSFCNLLDICSFIELLYCRLKESPGDEKEWRKRRVKRRHVLENRGAHSIRIYLQKVNTRKGMKWRAVELQEKQIQFTPGS